MATRVNLNPLKATTALTYLKQMSTYNNNDWAALYINLSKAQRRWGVLAKVLGKMESPIKARAMMYKATVQAVLLYDSEIWVVT